MFGAYFFVGDIMYESTRTAFSWLDFLSTFGGMQGIVVVVITMILETYNDTQLVSKSVRNMYFRRNPNPAQSKIQGDFRPIKFSFKDTLSEYGYFDCCLRRKSRTMNIFDRGQEKMREDLDVFKIVQTLYKLKSSIKVIVNKMKDPAIFKEIQQQFSQEVIINSSDEEPDDPVDEIIDFLNRDEKRTLYDDRYKFVGGRRVSVIGPGALTPGF